MKLIAKRVKQLSYIVFFALLLTACDSPSFNASGSSTAEAAQKYEYNVGASSTAGTGYRWTVVVCEVINKYSDFLTLNPITTTGSTENINLIANGEAPLGFSSASAAYSAANGLLDWEGTPVKGIEFVHFMYSDYFLAYLPAKTTVNSMADLMDGKRVVSFGETGSGGYTNNMTAINAMGYSIDQFKTEDLDLADGCAAITEGLLDCMIYYGAVHTSAVEEMRAGPAGLKILELTEEEVATACKNNPIFKPRILENAYPEIPPLRTFGAGFGLYANESIPDEVTYEITKLIDEHLDEMIAVLDLAKESTLENCVDAVSFVPMAGGTQKYLREKGLVK